MTDAPLYYRSAPPIGEIRLNRPNKLNAISSAMWMLLKDAVAAAAGDVEARLIVVSGEGGHFAAGADIAEFDRLHASPESSAAFGETMLTALFALETLGKPTLARIRGICVGGGCSIALACDFRYGAPSARFAVTPGRLGLVYSLADTRRLATTVGVANAKDLLFTGRRIDAEEALQIGLLDRLYADEEIDEATLLLARRLEETSPYSAAASKKMFALLAEGAADDDARAAAALAEAFGGEDMAEGRKAFLEKRRPNFRKR